MSLTNHYPFATIPLNYNLTSFEDFLDFQTLSIHYNQIYKEFVDDLNPMFFAEAKTKVKTLALSLKDNKEKLNQDIKFLHTLLNSIASKLKQSSTNQFVYQSVEDRFLYYLK